METQKQSWTIRFNSRNPVRVKSRYFIMRIDTYISYIIYVYIIYECSGYHIAWLKVTAVSEEYFYHFQNAKLHVREIHSG
jgi:hypothetical protein